MQVSGGQRRQRTVSERTQLHQRVRVVCVLLLIGYLSLGGRLFYLQVKRHAYYTAQANAIRLRTIPQAARRGTLFDCNNLPLAISIPVGDVVADPPAILNPEATAEAVARTLAPQVPGLSAPDLADRIQRARLKRTVKDKPDHYLLLVKNVPYAGIQALQAAADAEKAARVKDPLLALAGISTPIRTTRAYPNGDLAAQVVGFLNRGVSPSGSHPGIAPTGQYGVEKSCNALLTGRDGLITAEVDAAKHVIPGTEQKEMPVRNGQDVTLTLDTHLQAIAQEELERSVHEHQAESGSVVVLDPRDGDILALANLPIFDPNALKKLTYNNWNDRAVSDLYEPGLTLKTLTLAAVLDHEGLEAEHYRVVCNGSIRIGNHTIHCAKDPPKMGVHGNEDMRDVLRNSCNIGAAEYAMGLGAPTLYHYEQAFGLMDKPDCGLPGAQRSYLADPAIAHWSDIRLANVAFGQGISISALQLASVYATLANHGQRVYPHILRDTPPGPAVQVVKPEVAHEMLSLLRSVVTDGTGKPAQISDYLVGGKTGSAQVAEHGHYGDAYIGSFCGVAPLSHPRLVVLCVINKPVGVHWGAVVAAPVVHNVLKRALWYLKVPPDAPGQPDANDKNALKLAARKGRHSKRGERKA